MNDDHAQAFEQPNNQHPEVHFKAYYGNQNVPHRTNSAAKIVNAGKIMEQILRAK